MQIVHVTEAFEGGVIEFLRCLTGSTPDIDYTVVYGDRKIGFEEASKTFNSNVKFILWPSVSREISPVKDLKALREIISILKKEQPFDILHLHSSKAGILGRVAARVINHKKVIYAPHGAAFLRKDISMLTRSFYITIERAANIFPGKVIGVSKSEADTYKKIGIKAEYVNNGKFFPASPEKNFVDDNFNIVTTGRIVQQKNPRWFNEIAKSLEQIPYIKFIWIGDGIERNMLTAKNIHITGWISRKEVEQNLHQAHLYLSTALWEGLPYAVLEAMSMKLPLLLSNCPGNIDLVENGENGFSYTSPQQAVIIIKDYIENKSMMQAHGKASFNMLQTFFSVEQMQQGYRNLYAKMVSRS